MEHAFVNGDLDACIAVRFWNATGEAIATQPATAGSGAYAGSGKSAVGA